VGGKGGVSDVDGGVAHEFLEVARAKRISDIPPDTRQNDLLWEMGPFEAHRHRLSPSLGIWVTERAYPKSPQRKIATEPPELYRLKGALLLQQSSDNHAETCFHHAMAIAQNQQAKSWELRAATSLARLWQQQGKRQEAHDLLAPVYGWFTEGFDTADLQEAKALLEALTG